MSIISDPTRAFLPLLKLTAFSDVQMTKKVDDVLLAYDPSALESTYTNSICDPKTIETQSGGGSYDGSKSSDLKITFLLDDTTYSSQKAFSLPNMSIDDRVDEVIKKLLNLCYTRNTTTDEPNYILLKPFNMPLVNSPGGGFKGRLLTMNIKNEMVNLTGDRVKAKVDCTFKEALSPEELEATR